MRVRLLLARSGNSGFQIYLQPTADRSSTELPHTEARGRFTATTALSLAMHMGVQLESHRLFLIYEEGHDAYYGCLLSNEEVANLRTESGWQGWIDIDTILQGDQYDSQLRVLLRWRTKEELTLRAISQLVGKRRRAA